MSIPKRILERKYLRESRDEDKDSQDKTVSMAVLDDYAGIAPPFFNAIPGLKAETFTDTIDASTLDGFQQLQQRLQPFSIVSSMRERTPFPGALLDQLPNLKLLLTTGMRNASIDLEAASRNSIVVTGTKGLPHPDEDPDATPIQPPPAAYDSTTQQTWALLLSLCGRIPRDNEAIRSDRTAWQSGMAIALGGKTIGILGLGRLGANVAHIAKRAFGMNVIAWSENLTQEKADAAAQAAGLTSGTFTVVNKDELFSNADVVSIHYVLSERSKGIVGSKELALMKPTALLVNTARAQLIDEAALWDTMQRGAIHGAALDVWWKEPLPVDSPWRSYKGKSELVMSPHMGYVNGGTMQRWYDEQAEIITTWMAGEEVENRLN